MTDKSEEVTHLQADKTPTVTRRVDTNRRGEPITVDVVSPYKDDKGKSHLGRVIVTPTKPH